MNLGFGFDFSGAPPFGIGRVGGFDFLLTTGTSKVKGYPPFAKGAKDGAPANSNAKSKTKPKAKQPQEKLPEWYHRRRGDASCGNA